MSDSQGGTSPRERLPIKLVLPNQGSERRVPGGGGNGQPFRTVDPAYRSGLINQLGSVHAALKPVLAELDVAPMRVKLIPRAFAKSHRPEQLFSTRTCPIVGGGRLGELYVKATSGGLAALADLIDQGASPRLIKELSCIESIEPVTPVDRMGGLTPTEVLKESPRVQSGFTAKVRLFGMGGDDDEMRLVSDFEARCANAGIELSSAGYARSSLTYSAVCRDAGDVGLLSAITGVRKIGGMPLVRTIRPQAFNLGPLPNLPTRAEVDGDIPVVVVVDSGVSRVVPGLDSWVVGRESTVAPAYRNEEHGTFVAGLICWGDRLNPTVPGIDSNPCGVFDLQVIPNSDPARGEVDSIGEQELLVTLDGALRAHANEYKVWNISLGTDMVCSLDDFSTFAEELDNLQERYGVSFVISAGNFTSVPLLHYPRTAGQLAAGRITAPADTVLGITVGAVSHVGYHQGGPAMNEPSPFSRHGAGPNYVIKPDLVHYGGTCTHDASQIAGIRSVTPSGTADDLGTSFSAPLVSRTLAQIYHQVTPAPTPVLARALLTHNARDPRTGRRVPDGEEDFFGFGLPAVVPYCLECAPHTSTLVFEDVLRPGYYLEWDDFPYPESLVRDGRYYGDISMTVAFEPARGARWGSEYCETHIDASFGVYRDRVNRTTGEITSHFVGLVPPEHKNPGALYESFQIEKLRKWAPVRTYHGEMGPGGERGTRWRLKVRLLNRHGSEAAGELARPQPFALVVTISDPDGVAPVYDEMARRVLSRFQTDNLTVRAAARIRGTVQ